MERRDKTSLWPPPRPATVLWVCLVLMSGCAAPSMSSLPIVGKLAKSGNQQNVVSDERYVSLEQTAVAAASTEAPERLPPVDPVDAAATTLLTPAAAAMTAPNGEHRAEEIPTGTKQGDVVSDPEPDSLQIHPIDLPTALRLADAGNLQIAFAREQIEQSLARVSSADALWMPSLRGGSSYNKHEGQIQDTAGTVSDVSRSNFFTGFGSGANAAASPMFPGLYANFQMADAVFQPLAERQAAAARQHAAAAATNDVLLRVAAAYLDLVRTAEDLAIASEARQYAQQLADLTGQYAASGEGLQSDAERALAELAVRKNDELRAEEATRVASARLAQFLRLDPTLRLSPLDPAIVPLDLVCPTSSVGELVVQGLTARPELAEQRHLVAFAAQRMRREQYSALMPSVVLGVSYGGFGGGVGGTLAQFNNRMDADAIAFWQMRNLGFGDRAARAEARSLVRQADLNRLSMLDQVAREIVEAHAQVTLRRKEIAIAHEGLTAASASYRHNLERIEQAKGLPIEAMQALQAIIQARRELLRALIDYNVAQFTLYRAVGWPTRFPETGAKGST